MSVPTRHGGSEVGENPYENADIDQALSILDSRMRMLLDTRRVIRNFRDSHDDTDRRMALSMAAAVITDGPLIASHIRFEQIATHDHGLALQMQSAENARRPMTLTDRHLPPPGETEPDRDQMIFLARLAGRYISPAACEILLPSDILTTEQQAGNSSSLAAIHECVICGDSKYWYETLLMPCGDEQCVACLQELFTGSYKDESLFPPKCCRQVIPINKHLRLLIGPALLTPYANPASVVLRSVTCVVKSGRVVDAINSMRTVSLSEPRSWWIVMVRVHERKRNVRWRYNEWPTWSASVTHANILVLGGEYRLLETGSFANTVEAAPVHLGSTLQEMDAMTAELVLQLQLEDLEELESQSKGKQKQGNVTDAQVARQLQQEEFQNARIWVADSSLAQSMARAVQADGPVVTQLRQDEAVAQADRNMAMSLAEQRRTSATETNTESAEQLDDQLLARLAKLNMNAAPGEPSQFTATSVAAEVNEDDEEGDQPESSTWAATRRSTSLSVVSVIYELAIAANGIVCDHLMQEFWID
ncbi:uncharacterized protein AB675_4128 [Cyphellophora attinorum]|uniref:RING-type domain-containing protein n=1 Tax=Cyphellophora attinorum TaxID=1664694 RepID=A0A0N1NZD8_9EURO|nr:uncharacterized protein AB675_4128 [Phialophora attinorum]KPI38602.1 hypothetical protein AB675_4128 [Phialophora attinorum]